MMNIPSARCPEIPRCPVFGLCGGCQYQDLAYPEELRQKQSALNGLFSGRWPESFFSGGIDEIVPSPREYHYRNRLDMKLIKTKQQDVFIGFAPGSLNRVIPVEQCPIALEPISAFIPELKRQAVSSLPAGYRNANLTVRCGDDGHVRWGGIGRRSLRLKEDEYFWTSLAGKKIFYGLETFFQANLSILPLVIEKIKSLDIWGGDTEFLDLYGGVGFFSLCLADTAGQSVLVEENIHAVRIAEFNCRFNQAENCRIVNARVEQLADIIASAETGQRLSRVAMVDPPRSGLSPAAAQYLAESELFRHLLYLSCHPQALTRDLDIFCEQGWRLERVMPFDFFPKTKHVETLVLLTAGARKPSRDFSS